MIGVRGPAAVFGSVPVGQREDHCELAGGGSISVPPVDWQERGIEIAVLVEPGTGRCAGYSAAIDALDGRQFAAVDQNRVPNICSIGGGGG